MKIMTPPVNDLGLVAFDEQVICECQAARKGQEIKSASGILLGERTQGDVPLYGTIVSVGENVSEAVKALVGRDIPLPNGHISNIPDPRIAYGEMPFNSKESRIFVTMHYKAVRAVYDVRVEPSTKLAQPAASKLSLM
ncbi:head assembly chaperone protein [Aeromonas phage Ahp1_CNU-2021]|nr:head assembly chaperone protein [Aeromonas phage Ahp1_CNU-2021]